MIRAFVLLLMVTLAIVGVAWWYMPIDSPESKNGSTSSPTRAEEGFLTTRNEFNDKMEEYKRRKSDAEIQISRLNILKQAAAKRLREFGVTKAHELEDNARAQIVYSEVKTLIDNTRKLKSDIQIYEEAIFRIEAALRDIESRQLMENVSVSDELYLQLNTVVKDLDDRLIKPDKGLEQFETQAVLDDILGTDESK